MCLVLCICIGLAIVGLNVKHMAVAFLKDESLKILRDHVTFQDEEKNDVFFDSAERFLCREPVRNSGNLQHIYGLRGYAILLLDRRHMLLHIAARCRPLMPKPM